MNLEKRKVKIYDLPIDPNVSILYPEQVIIRFPDGTIHLVTGWNKFIREHNLNAGNLWRTLNPVKRTYEINGRFYTYWQKNTHAKGYTLLGKFNDYPDREYTQVSGNV